MHSLEYWEKNSPQQQQHLYWTVNLAKNLGNKHMHATRIPIWCYSYINSVTYYLYEKFGWQCNRNSIWNSIGARHKAIALITSILLFRWIHVRLMRMLIYELKHIFFYSFYSMTKWLFGTNQTHSDILRRCVLLFSLLLLSFQNVYKFIEITLKSMRCWLQVKTQQCTGNWYGQQ